VGADQLVGIRLHLVQKLLKRVDTTLPLRPLELVDFVRWRENTAGFTSEEMAIGQRKKATPMGKATILKTNRFTNALHPRLGKDVGYR
jgi:hypothetical protein